MFYTTYHSKNCLTSGSFFSPAHEKQAISQVTFLQTFKEKIHHRVLLVETYLREEKNRDVALIRGQLLCNAMHMVASVVLLMTTSQANAGAHMQRQIMGREVVVTITKGQLDFGTWERIFYGEFDARRKNVFYFKLSESYRLKVKGGNARTTRAYVVFTVSCQPANTS